MTEQRLKEHFGGILAEELTKLMNEENKWYPNSVKHKNLEYYHTGKVGQHMKTKEHSAEYEHLDPNTGSKTGKRVWLYKSGRIEQD